ncbi:hypothetical protein GCM10025771_09750 [Niveibacterium umoris]|uniref:Restriction endonuclease type IV Mrr domain-containing protein n=1 Tax=Niveibacterium umoris TaxID=1193620 RepID=A0A840BRN6_9RHOO|nr:restriction endonuclease [Niveibacterium umoris]MBB4013476.1 hypothetical protein [Niveibacterium umoris]
MTAYPTHSDTAASPLRWILALAAASLALIALTSPAAAHLQVSLRAAGFAVVGGLALFAAALYRRKDRPAAPQDDPELTLLVLDPPKRVPSTANRVSSANIEAPLARRAEKWSPELLATVKGDRFARLCVRYHAARLLTTEPMPMASGRGLAVSGAGLVVHALSHTNEMAGADQIADLIADMSRATVQRGVLMNASGFTEEARSLATAHGITLIDSRLLYLMLRRLPDEAQRDLLAFATGSA